MLSIEQDVDLQADAAVHKSDLFRTPGLFLVRTMLAGAYIGIGVLIMVMIRNGLNLMNVSPYWQGSAIGGIIILALLVERLISARANRR